MKKHKCKDCPDRYPGCHDHCKTYKDIDAYNKREKETNKGKVEAFRYTMEMTCGYADTRRKKQRQGRLTYSKKG